MKHSLQEGSNANTEIILIKGFVITKQELHISSAHKWLLASQFIKGKGDKNVNCQNIQD